MPGNLVEEVEKLVRLRNMGELTEEIFVEAKERLLHGIPGFSDEFPDHKSFWKSSTGIRVLYGVLYIAGMLLSFLSLFILWLILLVGVGIPLLAVPLVFLGFLGFLVVSWYFEVEDLFGLISFAWTPIIRTLKPTILGPLKKEDIKQHRKDALLEGFMLGVFFICNFLFAVALFGGRDFSRSAGNTNIIIYMAIISAFLVIIIWKHAKEASRQYQIGDELYKLVRLRAAGVLTEKEFEAAELLLEIKVHKINWLLKRGFVYLILGHFYFTGIMDGRIVIVCVILAIDMAWALAVALYERYAFEEYRG